jgi:thiol-disulfide isomerase/thioredoxin
VPYLIAAVAVVAVACALDLVLTVAVLRRLRRQATTLAQLDGSDDAQVAVRELVGRPVPEAAGSGHGDPRPRLIGFFSPGCPACHEQAPHFLRRARREAGRGVDALAVVCGEAGEAAELAAQLGEAATVVTDGDDLAAALGVSLFPTFLVADNGTVTAAALAVGKLPSAVPAA